MRNALLLLFLVSFSFSANFFLSPYGDSLEARASVYNSRIEEVPPPLRFLWSGENANVRVSGLGDFYVEFGDRGEIKRIKRGPGQTASLEITLSQATLRELDSGKLSLDSAVRGNRMVFREKNLIVLLKLQIAMGFVNAGGAWDGTIGSGLDRLFSALPF